VRARAALLVAAAALLAAGCTGPAGAPPPRPPVTLGLLADGTGVDRVTDTEAVRGAQLAVDLVNGAHPELDLPLAATAGLPGLDGGRIALAVADSGGDPGRAEAAAGQLVTGRAVVGVVATERAEVVAIAGAYTDRRQLPMVDGGTTAGYLLDVGLEWYFRTGPSDRMLAEAAFSLLTGDGDGVGSGAGDDPIVVLTAAPDRGADLVAMLTELAAGDGLRLADPIPADAAALSLLTAGVGDPEGTGAGDAAGAGATAGPVIAVATTGADRAVLARSWEQWRLGRPLIAMGPGFADDLPAADPGVLRATTWSAELAGRRPLTRAVSALYEDRHGAPMTAAAAAAFTATLTLAQAVDAAGSTAPAAVRTALRGLSVPATHTIMPWNGVRFGADGQNELAAAVVEQAAGGGIRLVHPPEMATVEVAWTSGPAR
jgi:branched-chain amino acid transport system substrate-binding protein